MCFATTSDPRAVLGHVSGGRVLDVATGDGQFIRFLIDGLRDHAEVIGIDSDPIEGTLFVERFGDHPGITFELMDVLDMRFPDASFDTVAIAHSLCRFHDPRSVLARLTRLLRSGGHLVVAGAYRDHQDAPAAMYVELHDWWAAVDDASGKVHREDPRRDELVALTAAIGLSDLRWFDVGDPDQDPMDPVVITNIDATIDRAIRAVDGRPALQGHGEMLRARMHRVGFRMPTSLVAVGRW